MTATVRVSVRGDDIRKQLDNVMSRLRDEAVPKGTALAQAALVGKIREQLQGSRILGLGDNQPSAWRARPVEKTESGAAGPVSTTHPMGKFRDTGGTIRPGKSAARAGKNQGKPTKAVIIPLEKARTAGGVSRAGRVGSSGGVSQFGPLKAQYFRPKITGNGSEIVGRLVAKTSGPAKTTQASGDALFLLARKVVVPPYPYIRESVTAALPDIKQAMVLALRSSGAR